MQIDVQLLKLLSSKMCHDIIQPVNSLKFAMEMLKDSDSLENNEALEIAISGVDNLVRRVSVFRMAFGASSIGEGEIGLLKTKELIIDMFKEKNTNITWTKETDKILYSISSAEGLKILLNLFLVAFYIVLKNSTISLSAKHVDNMVVFVLDVKGSNIKLGLDSLNAINLISEVEELNPRNIQCYYTGLLVKLAKGRLEVRESLAGEVNIACGLYIV